MSTFITDLELSTRVRNVLPPDMTVEQFLKLTEKEVRAMRNLGRRSWYEIEDMQRHLRVPTTQDQVSELKDDLRRFHRRARDLGLTLTVVEGYPRLARILGP